METQIIDFAQWYSGMERPKVEAAYQRYLKERREALSQAAVMCSADGCKELAVSKDGKCHKHFQQDMDAYWNRHCT